MVNHYFRVTFYRYLLADEDGNVLLPTRDNNVDIIAVFTDVPFSDLSKYYKLLPHLDFEVKLLVSPDSII